MRQTLLAGGGIRRPSHERARMAVSEGGRCKPKRVGFGRWSGQAAADAWKSAAISWAALPALEFRELRAAEERVLS